MTANVHALRSWPDLRAWLAADAGAAELTLSGCLLSPTYRYQALLRVTEYADNAWRSPLGRLVVAVLKRLRVAQGIRLGFTVPLHVAGPGLCLAHWGTVVMHPDVRLGSNCRVHVDVVLGMAYGKTPTIGDDVYIGPGAKVFGGVTIGDGCVIGANATVGTSFPPKTLIVGSPARAAGAVTRWP